MFLVWENDTGEIEITLIKIVEDFILDPGINHISKKEATDESVVGLKLFDKPIIGYASANDELYEKFKIDEKITHGRFIPPQEWLGRC